MSFSPATQRLIATLGNEPFNLTGREIAEFIQLAEIQGLKPISSFPERAEESPPPGDPSPPKPKESDGKTSENDAGKHTNNTKKPPTAEILPPLVEQTTTPVPPSNLKPIAVTDAAAIHNPLALAKALKSLAQKVAVGSSQELDEAATVESIATTGVWLPVLKPAEELWLDIALVLDTSPSMALWQRIDKEIHRLLARYGEFRDVRLWQLQIINNQVLFCSRGGKHHKYHSPKELLTGDCRRMVVVISDCVGNAWHSGAMHQVLQKWAAKLPTIILQVFPERLWSKTALARSLIVEFQAKQSGLASQHLQPYARDLWDEELVEILPKQALKLPVVSIEPDDFVNWAEVVSGNRQARVLGILGEPEQTEFSMGATAKPSPALSPGEITALIDDFFYASPLAKQLAILLASAPVITLPIIRLIKQSQLPQASSVHIAEVLMSGLFRVSNGLRPTFDNAERVTFELVDPEVRRRLRAGTSLKAARDVVEEVSKHIAKRFGFSRTDQFWALLKTPEQGKTSEETDFLEAFAQVTADVLRGMGGEFTRIAEELEQAGNVSPETDKNFLSRFNRESIHITVNTLEVLEGEAETQFLALKALFEGTSNEFAASGIDISDGELRDGQVGALAADIRGQDYQAQALHIFDRQIKQLSTTPELQEWSGETVFVDRRGEVIERQTVTVPYYEVDLEDKPTIAPGHYRVFPGKELSDKPLPELQILRMLVIPGGILKRKNDRVLIEPFFLGQTPVTQAQWWAIARRTDLKVNRDLKPTPSSFIKDFEGQSHWLRPVERVSWYEAMEFCQRLAKLTGEFYCLPTEWQWQYACQAMRTPPDNGDYPPFHFGEALTDQLANYDATETYADEPKGQYLQQTTPVGRYPANAYGLQDMHGNVWEWMLNLYESDSPGPINLNTSTKELITTGQMYEDSGIRVLRGGSWDGDPGFCRGAIRVRGYPDDQLSGNGFRVACRFPMP